jgi:uncharacterized membrane protein YedE/YeeE
MSTDTLAIVWGLGIGAVVGAAAFLSSFCALGAVADILFARDWRRMRSWMLAAGIALLGTQVLDSLRLIHIDRILLPYLLWLPTLIGGICFGFGMALAGGCINRALVRLGAGSLKSLVTVMVVGLSAAATATGILAPLRKLLDREGSLDLMIAPDGLHRLFAAVMPVQHEVMRWMFIVVLAGGLIIFCLKDQWFRTTYDQLIGSVVIGAMIPLSWYATDILATPSALNFAAPVGDLVRMVSQQTTFSFAVAAVIGVPLGAFIAAAATGDLGLETFTDRQDLPRHLVGAVLMGFGGTLAAGCTFGQGLSGLSTLSVSAMITVAAIIFGCLWGIRTFEAGGPWAGLKLALKRGV